MWASVNGARRVIYPLTDAKVEIAGKTGTAEFGKVNRDGTYEHTHAWVTGFFPYDKPKYSFVIFLEDGGESNNASILAREFIDWYIDYSAKK
jgi:penicillin-binding protein 2